MGGERADPAVAGVGSPEKSSAPILAPIGSLGIFWSLIEPVLTALGPRQICEVGVDTGTLTAKLLAWAEANGCAYVGIDPAPDPAVGRRFFGPGNTVGRRLLPLPSLAALPTLECSDAYFLDGDHNYHTVRGELDLIAASLERADGAARRAPVVFMHDVGWPWGRRDMYYLPTAVPAHARQPWSETLGVSPDRADLIDGGLREPGRYAIALGIGGPGNGVLTALEDFLSGPAGTGWEKIILPVAYGLGVLYRPDDPTLPTDCRERLVKLKTMAEVGGPLLQACEDNLLRLSLYGEYYRHQAAAESLAHFTTLGAYDDLKTHSDSLLVEYQRLAQAHERSKKTATVGDDLPRPDADHL